MTTTDDSARIWEHSGRIAIRIGDGKTQYITPRLAAWLAEELKLAQKQIRSGFHYETAELKPYKGDIQ